MYHGFSFITVTALTLLLCTSSCAIKRHPVDPFHGESTSDLFLVSVEAQRAYRESRWIDAVRLYQLLVERMPSDASAWFGLANTYARQGAFQPAIHAYEQSLRHNRTQAKAWFNLSSVYLLNAQFALRQSSLLLDKSDPSRSMVAQRLQWLDDFLHDRDLRKKIKGHGVEMVQ